MYISQYKTCNDNTVFFFAAISKKSHIQAVAEIKAFRYLEVSFIQTGNQSVWINEVPLEMQG